MVIECITKITLYHYTSKDAAEAIGAEEIIKSSTSKAGDARHGDGVYFNDMNPEDHTMSQVAYNNYRCPYAKKKLAYCVTVTMPKKLVEQCLVEKRRIFLHKGDVNLKKTEIYISKIEKSYFKVST